METLASGGSAGHSRALAGELPARRAGIYHLTSSPTRGPGPTHAWEINPGWILAPGCPRPWRLHKPPRRGGSTGPVEHGDVTLFWTVSGRPEGLQAPPQLTSKHSA